MVRQGSSRARRAPPRTRLPVTLVLLLLSTPAWPDAVLDVSGRVVATAPRLDVRVTLTNRGDLPAGPIDVSGELSGERGDARFSGTLAPGASGDVSLDFAPTPLRPGLHALTLLLEHPVEGSPDGAGNPPVASQRAWLLLALGANPKEAVQLRSEPLRLDVRGSLLVHVLSRDGEAHRVRLRALPARGLRSDGGPIDVAVPARGEATARIPIVRAGAARGTRQALLIVAETPDGPLSRTAVAVATVDVRPDPALLPRLRLPLLAIGLTLLALALGFEAWTRHSNRRSPLA